MSSFLAFFYLRFWYFISFSLFHPHPPQRFAGIFDFVCLFMFISFLCFTPSPQSKILSSNADPKKLIWVIFLSLSPSPRLRFRLFGSWLVPYANILHRNFLRFTPPPLPRLASGVGPEQFIEINIPIMDSLRPGLNPLVLKEGDSQVGVVLKEGVRMGEWVGWLRPDTTLFLSPFISVMMWTASALV